MENMKVEVKDNILTITVDLSKNLGASKSGKSLLIASTGGNMTVPHPTAHDIKLGLNCYRSL